MNVYFMRAVPGTIAARHTAMNMITVFSNNLTIGRFLYLLLALTVALPGTTGDTAAMPVSREQQTGPELEIPPNSFLDAARNRSFLVRFQHGSESYSPILAIPLSHPGESKELVLVFRVWDVDYPGEVTLSLGGQMIAEMDFTENEKWSGLQTIHIPRERLSTDDEQNILIFRNTVPEGEQYPWGVDLISFTAEKLPVGKRVFGDTEIGGEELSLAAFVFEGTESRTAPVLSYRLWDVDYRGEVEIFFNGRSLGPAEPTPGNQLWSSRRSLTLPPELVRQESLNTVCFHNVESPRSRLHWAVSEVAVSGAIPLPSFRAYGHMWNLVTHLDQVAYQFPADDPVDRVLTFQAYDIDSPEELQLELNGTLVRTFGSGVSDDEWSRTLEVVLPGSLIESRRPNRLVFINRYNPPHRYFWGVRSVILSQPLPADSPSGRISEGEDLEHEHRVVYTFPGHEGGTEIRFRAWDIDAKNELLVLLNGALIGEYGPLTGDREWSGEQVIQAADELVLDHGLNVLIFSAAYNPPKRYWWGVEGVSCRPSGASPEIRESRDQETDADRIIGDTNETMKVLPESLVSGGRVSLPKETWDSMLSRMVGGKVGSLVGESPKATAQRMGLNGGSLRVESRPAGASVYLGGSSGYRGTLVGTTPLDLSEIPAGVHQIRVLKEGFAEHTERVTVPEASTGSFQVTMVPFAPLGFGVPRLLETIEGRPLKGDAHCAPRVLDHDGDGQPDLVCGDEYGYLTLFRQASPGETTPLFETGIRLGEAVDSFSSPFPIDWDDDGREDLLVGNGLGMIAFYRNVGGTGSQPVYDQGQWLTINDSEMDEIDVGEGACPVVADWDGDGLKDLLCGSSTGQILIFRNRGGGRIPVLSPGRPVFSAPPDESIYPNDTAPFVVSDWNGDARLDMLLATAWGNFYLYLSREAVDGTRGRFGDGELVSYERGILYLGPNPVPSVVDLNRDGLPDLVVGNGEGEIWFVPGKKKETNDR